MANSLFINSRKSRKAQASWSWVYGLVFLFALGILYTVFLYVFEGQLAPTIKGVATNTIQDPVALNTVITGIDRYLTYFKMMPYILFVVVVIYMFATAIYKQSAGYQ